MVELCLSYEKRFESYGSYGKTTYGNYGRYDLRISGNDDRHILDFKLVHDGKNAFPIGTSLRKSPTVVDNSQEIAISKRLKQRFNTQRDSTMQENV